MTDKTLKERYDEFLSLINLELMKRGGIFDLYKEKLIMRSFDNIISLVNDQQARIEELEKRDGWFPIETIPKCGVKVYLKNKFNLIDTGKWCDYTNDVDCELDGEISPDLGHGDYTHWQPIRELTKQGDKNE